MPKILITFLFLLLFPAVASSATWVGTKNFSGAFSWDSCGLERPFGSAAFITVPKVPGSESIGQAPSNGTVTMACRLNGSNKGAQSAGSATAGQWWRIIYTTGGNLSASYSNNYVPPPTEPVTCTDGLKSPDESGIDCGDPLCDDPDKTCTEYCPVGFHLEERTSPPPESWTATLCYSDDDTADYTFTKLLDQCPSGSFQSLTDSSLCVSVQIQTYASADYSTETTTDEDPPVNSYNASSSSTTSTTTSDTVVNPDTSTTTTETTAILVTNNDNTTTNTTTTTETTNNVDNSTTTITTENIITTTPAGESIGSETVTTTNRDASGQVTGTSSTSTDLATAPGAGDGIGDDAPSKDSEDVVEGLTEEIDGDPGGELVGEAGGAVDGMYTELTDAMADIQSEYDAEKDSWLVSETITDQLLFLPAPQACTDVSYELSNGYSATISCTSMTRIKELLGWILSILTLVWIYDLAFRQDIVKG